MPAPMQESQADSDPSMPVLSSGHPVPSEVYSDCAFR